MCIRDSHFSTLNEFLLGKPLPPSLKQDPFWSRGCIVEVGCGTSWPFAARAFPRQVHGHWQVVFGGNDPNHCLKIMAGQMRTAAKTIRLADLHVDCSASLAYGQTVQSYQGRDRQSDREAASLFLHNLPPDSAALSPWAAGSLVYTCGVTAALTTWNLFFCSMLLP